MGSERLPDGGPIAASRSWSGTSCKENNVLPDPIHPAIVHLPVALAILLPLMIGGAFLLARRGTPIRTLWTGVVAAAALLAGSSWLAVETGEGQEERVEHVVSEGALETHEERADAFLALAAGTLILTLVGLAKDRAGRIGRVAATVAAVALLPAGYMVGHSGGQLVYRDGAAQAYVPVNGEGQAATDKRRAKASDKDEDDH
jgi:uncharacterized membrane protein